MSNWEPKYSKQGPKEKNCGLHCISMITHLPIPVIEEYVHKSQRGTSKKDVAFGLYMMGCNVEEYSTSGILPDLAIIHVRNHWALYFKGKVYCSCLGIMTLKQYRGRVKGFIKVEIPKH